MEYKLRNEAGPAKKRASFRTATKSDIKYSSPGRNIHMQALSSRGQQALLKNSLNQNNILPILPREASHLPQDDVKYITLSSDEEMEEEDQQNSSMEEFILPNIKMEELELPEKVPPSKNPLLDTKTKVQMFLNKRSLQRQVDTSDSQNPNVCEYCGRRAKSKVALGRHILRQHRNLRGPSLFTCETCGKEVKSEQSLKIHQVTHIQTRLFGCNLCDRNYKSQFYLDKHLKSSQHNATAQSFGRNESFTDESSLLIENVKGGLSSASPPPPTLSVEVSPENMFGTFPVMASTWKSTPLLSRASQATSQMTKKQDTGRSRSVISVGTSPPPPPLLKKITTELKPSHIQPTSFPPPQPAIEMSSIIPSSGVNNPFMMPPMAPMQGIPTPVMFYGHMIQPNGASFPSPIPSTQTPTPYSGMSTFMSGNASQQNMQQISYQMSPQSFFGQAQQAPPAKLFTCLECQAQFSVEAHLHSHMKQEHLNHCWKCPKCLDVMFFPAEFQKHYSQCNN